MDRTKRRDRGQALVEFSLVLIPFLWILMAVLDLGRGIYIYNGVSQAARELARVTSVHQCNATPGCAMGSSAETAGVAGTQQRLVPGFGGPGSTVTYACTTVNDAAVTALNGDGSCPSQQYVRVTVSVPFSAVTPFLGGFLPSSLSSASHIQIP
ncbi:MAG TPA: TadE/TadG family type IV pilus assembly protein [Candidatus Limnocylindrales bacterium]|jgi:Flp pilus assembly protein TadG|nr:TadE/TadG family type IV pilus assembly protein [Candidatus Limnocylindrales bacterium]